MKLDPKLMQQLLETFQVELEDQLQVITDGLLLLEKSQDDTTKQDTLNGVFRAAHNIKGAARGISVTTVSEISHHLESLFSVLKSGDIEPEAAIIDLCLTALDRIREAMTAHNEDREPNFDIQQLEDQLLTAAQTGQVEKEQTVDPSADGTTDGTADETAAESESKPDVAESDSDVPDALEKPAVESEIKKVTTQKAEKPKPSSLKSTPTSTPNPVSAKAAATSEVIRVTVDKLDSVSALAEELQVAKIGMDEHFSGMQVLHAQVEELFDLWSRSKKIFKKNAQQELSSEINQLMAYSLDSVHKLNDVSSRMYKDMRGTTNRLGFISTALQGDMRMLRLVPASTLLRPMVRSVRDIARQLNKQIKLDIIGDEIEMDRAVLEGLRDPLVHLLRNAIDHGIETPEERQAADKPEEGSIVLTVTSEGGQIQINIKDDGRGVCLERITESALKKKLVSSEELDAMSSDEILQLIFRPGFSSKEIITDVSGRGVGLDVVSANLRELKGSVRLETKEGEGTRFILMVPMTLTTERGLQVRAGGEDFVIPSTAVERILELSSDDVIEVEATQAVVLDGQPLPLCDMAAALELESKDRLITDRLPVVVVSKGWQVVAFTVDEVIGEREIIIKRLLPPLQSVRNVSGATLTGSGDIMMVLSAGDLVASALRVARSERFITGAETEEQVKLRVLVVDDSITTRTLERNILETRGYEVVVAVNGSEGWKTLQSENFDMIVTDIEMPVMNGYEFTQRVKQSEEYSQIPVVMVSSLSSEEEKKRGIEVGADAYIVKGDFESQALLEVVEQLI